MPNKRSLKKSIRQICGEAAVEILINFPAETARPLVRRLALLQSRTLANATFGYDLSPASFENKRAYNEAKHKYNRTAFDNLKKNFLAGLQDIVNDINKSLTPEQREANKSAK